MCMFFSSEENSLACILFASHVATHFEKHLRKWQWIYSVHVLPTFADRTPFNSERLTVEADY